MSRARKILALPVANSITANDYLVVEKASGNTTITSKLSGSVLKTVPGPYANDSVANTNSIDIGNLYYTTSGEVRIRIT